MDWLPAWPSPASLSGWARGLRDRLDGWLTGDQAGGAARAGRAQEPPGGGTQLIAGHGKAYVVDQRRGIVQQVDPATLADIGSPLDLAAPLDAAAFDGRGQLWVPVEGRGQLVPVSPEGPGQPVTVGTPHDQLMLTIAGGTPVVTDSASATVTIVGLDGGVKSVNLRSSVGLGLMLLVPASTAGPAVPVLVARPANDLIMLDTAGASTRSPVSLNATGNLAAPQPLGDRVYVPNLSTGNVIVYDLKLGRLAPRRIPVTGRPGPMLATLVDGQLQISDQGSGAAVIVNADGTTVPLGTALHPATPTPRPTPGRHRGG